jgi:uncharacterized protein YbjT (DUF2867 family)
MSKVLVIGSTGKKGSQVVTQLLEKGIEVKAANRNTDKIKEMFGEKVEAVAFDYTDTSNWDNAFQGVNKIFMITPSGDIDAEKVASQIVEKAKANDVKKIVYSTAMGVEFMEDIPMRKAEKIIENSGIDYIFTRPNWFNQNFVSIFLPIIKEKGKIYIPAADSKTSFVDTRDIAAVAVEGLLNDDLKNEAFAITGPEAIDHYEVAKLISEASGSDISYEPAEEDDYYQMLLEMGYPEQAAKMMLGLYASMRSGATAMISHDVEKVLNRKAIDFATFAKDYANAWK